MTDQTSRRDVIRLGAASAVALAAGGLTPRQARAQGVPIRTMGSKTVRLLEAFGEALAPGAKEAGLAHYVDAQLAKDPADSLLMIRYMDVPPPYGPFYEAGLDALDAASRTRFGEGFTRLTDDQRRAYIADLSREAPAGWPPPPEAPPSQLVYFVLRADAVDVVYGTEEGFERLGVPYMPHIYPETKW
jgi:hypothetical protein